MYEKSQDGPGLVLGSCFAVERIALTALHDEIRSMIDSRFELIHVSEQSCLLHTV